MSTVEPEKTLPAPGGEEVPAGPPRLLLLKTAPVPDPAGPVDEPEDEPAPAEEEAPEEDEGGETGGEREPGALARAWVWFRDGWREIVGVLEFRKFVIETVEDMIVSSKYLPRLAFDWAFDPDPRTDDDAWKKMGIRLLVVVGPPAGGVFLMLRPGGEVVLPIGILAWVIASWFVAEDARMDAKLRKLARKKKANAGSQAQVQRLAKKYNLSPGDVAELMKAKDEKQKGKKVSLEKDPVDDDPEPEEGEEEPRAWTQEDINRYVWDWVLEQIGKKNGIHLDVLLQRAKEKEGVPKLVEPETTQPDFRRGLEARGVTVGQVKVNGDNRTGVKKSDVPRA
ncbi:hypothetical protein [Streptomyces violaceusniger]|uniref:Uncharacterized protein n=1 Tax=Streptomyces violaceusniger (strain Tu 4113) TaxID=653045 RepID=G2PHM6_STRV4|nr:hypothetical protein [Streptomyces violaceusniger]AEM88827.1 hypothetical protein Strvi_0050 [Streptomyces violaceusniger Tu 4113]